MCDIDTHYRALLQKRPVIHMNNAWTIHHSYMVHHMCSACRLIDRSLLQKSPRTIHHSYIASHVWYHTQLQVSFAKEPYDVCLSIMCVIVMASRNPVEWIMCKWFVQMIQIILGTNVLYIGTRTNESWHTYKGVMAHVQRSHGTRTNESWHFTVFYIGAKYYLYHLQMILGTNVKQHTS